MQQPALVRIVEGRTHSRDDVGDQRRRQLFAGISSCAYGSVGALDIRHGDPQPPVLLPAVVQGHDVRVEKAGRDLRFPIEADPERRIVLHRRGQNLERVHPRQPWMFGEIHLAHSAHTESPDDPVAGEGIADIQGPCHRSRPGSTFMACMVSRL